MLNNSTGIATSIPTSSLRNFECGASSSYMDFRSNNPDINENEHLFTTVKSDPSDRKFRQGSDGDSLPESPLSSGYEGKYTNQLNSD